MTASRLNNPVPPTGQKPRREFLIAVPFQARLRLSTVEAGGHTDGTTLTSAVEPYNRTAIRASVRFNRAASATGGFRPGRIPAELPRRVSDKTPDRFSAGNSVLISLVAIE
jgi:hypothetical protein